MMMAPQTFLAEYENASYSELLKLKNELVQEIADFENSIGKGIEQSQIQPSPDVHYQWNLQVLGILCPMLGDKFNEEFEQ